MSPERFVSLLQSAIEKSPEPYTVAEVLKEIESGMASVIAGEASILVCTLHKHHDTVTAHGWLGAGDLTELVETVMPKAEAWARANNATRMTVEGRRGWARALKSGGFKELSVTVGREL